MTTNATTSPTTNPNNPDSTQQAIQAGYAQTATSSLSSNDENVRAVAHAFGYSAAQLAAIPAEANMGLSCGNPIAMAGIQPGETVLDLGSGGGLDVFLAAQQVGPSGQAIGVDMTPQMIERANQNALKGDASTHNKPYTNVQFKLGHIDQLPISDQSVDLVISNCVINLAPDKNKVFAEIFRVLKPGGRVAISDIATKQTLPEELANNLAALVGCIAGAIPITDYEQGLQNAGFDSVAVIDSGADLTAYAQVDGQAACCTPPSTEPASNNTASNESSCCSGTSCCTPNEQTNQSAQQTTASATLSPSASSNPSAKPMHTELGELFNRFNPNDYAASVKVFAVKPK